MNIFGEYYLYSNVDLTYKKENKILSIRCDYSTKRILYYKIILNENKFLEDELDEIISNSIYGLNITYTIKHQWLFLGF